MRAKITQSSSNYISYNKPLPPNPHFKRCWRQNAFAHIHCTATAVHVEYSVYYRIRKKQLSLACDNRGSATCGTTTTDAKPFTTPNMADETEHSCRCPVIIKSADKREKLNTLFSHCETERRRERERARDISIDFAVSFIFLSFCFDAKSAILHDLTLTRITLAVRDAAQ